MKDYLSTYTRKCQYFLLLGDSLVLLISIIVSYIARVYLEDLPFTINAIYDKVTPWVSIVLIIHIIVMYLLDQYDIDSISNKSRTSIMIVTSIMLGGVTASFFLFFVPKHIFGRQVLFIHLIIASLLMVSWRLFALRFLTKQNYVKRLAIAGHGQIVSAFIEDLSHIPNSGLSINNVCTTDTPPQAFCCSSDTLTHYDNISQMLRNRDFDAFAFDSTNGFFSNDQVREILKLRFEGKAVHDLSVLYETLTGKVPLMYINGQWLLKSPELQGRINPTYLNVKRMLDVVLAILLMVLSAPLFVLIAIAISLESEGPVFFVQERLGLNRKPFLCHKFRTMGKDAEKKSGPVWATENDPRITRVGRFLRRTRLDELPQLWDILKGVMTFVGPRPIRDHFARKLAETIPFYQLRFCIKPGLTGWAQVSHDYGGTVEGQLEKFQYELFYIRNMSLFLDVLTIGKTVKIMVKGKGL
jgi:exopolysaccharide biosynthesis polyprenyl glycosylphosphotransferase